jgi:hypothetical protein
MHPLENHLRNTVQQCSALAMPHDLENTAEENAVHPLEKNT